MSKIRVHELSKELNISTKEIIRQLQKINVSVKNHMTALEEDDVKKLLKHFSMNKSQLKGFEIKKIFGVQSYKFSFEDMVTILISENGCGKTTIISLLIGALKGDSNKLRSIPFESITLFFENENVTIYKKDIGMYKSKEEQRELLETIRPYISSFEYEMIRKSLIRNSKLFERDITQILKKIEPVLPDSLRYEFVNKYFVSEFENEKLAEKYLKIRKLLSDDIIYLPTYRRIEEDIESLGINIEGVHSISSRYKAATINFGINDVEEAINKLTEKLKDDAMREYSNMNGEILDELLMNEISGTKSVDEAKLKVIIGRIGRNKIRYHEELFNFINGSYKIENVEFLNYYLTKLIRIYDKQKPIDEKIKNYINVCNNYLVNIEFHYDEVMAEVKLRNKHTKQNINYSNLSSGEKQILSIFAKLYLDENNQSIIIIDEPELSLSLTWQRKLLPDIIKSRKCSLLIATTHSPFVFQNEYFDRAKELEMFLI